MPGEGTACQRPICQDGAMRSIRWLEWARHIVRPNARGGTALRETIWLAHAFVVGDGALDQALCGDKPGPIVRIIHPELKHDKCETCDEILRSMGGPHPPAVNEKSSSIVYVPEHTYEEWDP